MTKPSLLTLRMHRYAVAGVGVSVIGLSLLALWYAIQLDGFTDQIACLTQGGDSCRSYLGNHETASRLMLAFMVVPVASGVLLGVPIVAQELERSSTYLAWTLEPSRWRWLLQRSIPLAVFALLIGLVAGTAADALEARIFPFADPSVSFRDYGLRGPLVAARLLLAFACGTLAGAIVGRTLNALVLATTLWALLVVGVSTFHDGLLASSAVPILNEGVGHGFAGREMDFRYELPSGELLTWDQLSDRFPAPEDLERQVSGAKQIVLVVPPARYGSAVAAEAAGTGAVASAAFMATIAIVLRRQPAPGWVAVRTAAPLRARKRRDGARRQHDTGRGLGIFGIARMMLWPHRIELVAAASVALIASVGIALVVAQLALTSPPPECLTDLTNIPTSEECASVDEFLLVASEWGNRMFAMMAVLPWVVGVLVGVVIVAREIESGTALLAWSLQPDRVQWLVIRAGIAICLVVILLSVPSAIATELQRVARPWVAPELTLDNYALRGPLVVLRGVLGFTIALFAGALVARVLPSLLLAAALCLGAAAILQFLWPYGQPSEPDRTTSGAVQPATPSGRPSVPGFRIREVEFRESLVLVPLAAGALLATSMVVTRRPPY